MIWPRQVVQVFVFTHVDFRCGGNHAVDDQGVVAVLCRREDEARVDRVVARQRRQTAVAQGPFGINLFLCQGIGVDVDAGSEAAFVGELVVAAAVVGQAQLEISPSNT